MRESDPHGFCKKISDLDLANSKLLDFLVDEGLQPHNTRLLLTIENFWAFIDLETLTVAMGRNHGSVMLTLDHDIFRSLYANPGTDGK